MWERFQLAEMTVSRWESRRSFAIEAANATAIQSITWKPHRIMAVSIKLTINVVVVWQNDILVVANSNREAYSRYNPFNSNKLRKLIERHWTAQIKIHHSSLWHRLEPYHKFSFSHFIVGRFFSSSSSSSFVLFHSRFRPLRPFLWSSQFACAIRNIGCMHARYDTETWCHGGNHAMP